MNNLHDYRIRFLDAEGTFIEDVPLVAESLSVAIDCAGTIGAEMGAADFFVTSMRDIEIEKDADMISFASSCIRSARLIALRAFKSGSLAPSSAAELVPESGVTTAK
jgi:hypothetical protein